MVKSLCTKLKEEKIDFIIRPLPDMEHYMNISKLFKKIFLKI